MTETAFVPDIIPGLVYQDIRAAHDFLVDVMGFASGGLYEEGGRVVHGEVRVGERRIWLHRVTHEHGLDAPRALPLNHGGIVVFVPDVDAHYARVKAAGAEVTSEPVDQAYGQREYGVRDPEGHRWYVATPLPAAVVRS
ncbi:MAG TPA: VOC family protein [Acidimicrobiales bacterium]|nr:VOC family protein [Acidimicrobiales bacterium]